MAIFKRGRVYWYNFWWRGEHVQRSTKQGNPRVARQIEAAYQTQLAKSEVGIEPHRSVPKLKEFATSEFLPWAEATFKQKRKTFVWYRGGVRRLSEFDAIASCRLDLITGETVSGYVAHRQTCGLGVIGINRELQVLRRILHVALEWGRTPRISTIKMLPGEQGRERVLTAEEESAYLSKSAEPVRSLAVMMLDSGVRPEEGFRLKWEFVNLTRGQHGALFVPFGKTKAARRWLPMTPRVRATLEAQCGEISKPSEGWVFPAPTKSGHIEPSTIRKKHARAIVQSGVTPFVLYALRHTFLTRLGEAGCDVWTLARIAGHSKISMSERYVHPSDDAVQRAFGRLSGDGPARPVGSVLDPGV